MPEAKGIQKIVDGLERDLSGPLAETCLLLVNRLSQMPADQLRRLTFPLLGGLAEREPQDALLQSAVTALTTVRHNPLVLYFIFLDVEDDREIDVSAAEVMQSLKDGLFIHPRTGIPVAEFKALLQPAYRISPEFSSVLLDARN